MAQSFSTVRSLSVTEGELAERKRERIQQRKAAGRKALEERRKKEEELAKKSKLRFGRVKVRQYGF